MTTAQCCPQDGLSTNPNHTAPSSPRQLQRHSATSPTTQPRYRPILRAQRIGHDTPPPIPTAQRHNTPTRQPLSTAILSAQRIGHIANACGRARYHFQSRNEPGPAPRPPSQKQEPFATHSGNVTKRVSFENSSLSIALHLMILYDES